MKFTSKWNCIATGTLLVLFALITLGATGCTVYNSGMTLLSPDYLKQRPQYFPRGTEFPFPNEAAALQSADQDQRR